MKSPTSQSQRFGPIESLSVIGCTGSLGRTVCDVAYELAIPCKAVAGWTNQVELARTVDLHGPEFAVCRDEPGPELTAIAGRHQTTIGYGRSALVDAVGRTAASAVAVTMGSIAGLQPALTAIETGRPLVMGCKEALVGAGGLLVRQAKIRDVPIRPLDSEHAAAQLLIEHVGGVHHVKRLILTGTGGSVRDVLPTQRAGLGVDRVLTHPVWSMGRKITVDSATLINKAMELVEAVHLFGIPIDQIDVMYDPAGRIHAALLTTDSRLFVHEAPARMREPTLWALGYGHLSATRILDGDDAEKALVQLGIPPDHDMSAIELGRRAVGYGGTAAMALEAADAVAVDRFLSGGIPLGSIVETVTRVLDLIGPTASRLDPFSLDDILATGDEASKMAAELLKKPRSTP